MNKEIKAGGRLRIAGMLVIGTEVYQQSVYSVWVNLFAVLGLMPVFAVGITRFFIPICWEAA